MIEQKQPIHWRSDPVSTTDLVRYAGVSGDFNRIHFDHPFATAAGLKDVVVHGMLTMGFAATCAQKALGPSAIVQELSARFVTPVWAGDVVEVEATPSEAKNGVAFELVARVGGTIVLKGRVVGAAHPGNEA